MPGKSTVKKKIVKKTVSKKTVKKVVPKKTTSKKKTTLQRAGIRSGKVKKKASVKRGRASLKRSNERSGKSSTAKKVRIPVHKVISPDQYFWNNHGPIVKDMDDLANALQEISDDQFFHHTKREPGINDFVNWIETVFEDQMLAQRFARARTRNGARRIVLTYVSRGR